MKTYAFPDPATCQIVTKNRQRLYKTPDGYFPGVTTVKKVLGLGSEALIAWAANLERSAVLEAVAEVYAEGHYDDSPAGIAAAVEERIGTTKQHQLVLSRAADIGTSIHQAIQFKLKTDLGLFAGIEPTLTDEAEWGFMAWQDWWKDSGLKAVAVEQPVWDKDLRYAGTIDILAEDPKRGLGVVDTKSSKGIYDDFHVQVAAYMHAARQWEEINWGMIVRVPEVTTDPSFEVKELGQLYDKTRSEEDLFECFKACRTLYGLLVEKEIR